MNKRILTRKQRFQVWVVRTIIKWFPMRNVGRFKVGDAVKYNWMAKWYIMSAIKDKVDTVFVIADFYAKGENAIYTSGHSSSVFWIKKVKIKKK